MYIENVERGDSLSQVDEVIFYLLSNVKGLFSIQANELKSVVYRYETINLFNTKEEHRK